MLKVTMMFRGRAVEEGGVGDKEGGKLSSPEGKQGEGGTSFQKDFVNIR